MKTLSFKLKDNSFFVKFYEKFEKKKKIKCNGKVIAICFFGSFKKLCSI